MAVGHDRVDVGEFLEAREAAMREHRTQIAPNALRFALVDSRIPAPVPEDDLFAGLRQAQPARGQR